MVAKFIRATKINNIIHNTISTINVHHCLIYQSLFRWQPILPCFIILQVTVIAWRWAMAFIELMHRNESSIKLSIKTPHCIMIPHNIMACRMVLKYYMSVSVKYFQFHTIIYILISQDIFTTLPQRGRKIPHCLCAFQLSKWQQHNKNQQNRQAYHILPQDGYIRRWK